MLRVRVFYVVCVLALLLLVAGGIRAQQDTGTISGRVADTTGAVIPGATVQVQDTETGLSRDTQTDSGGRYQFPNLPIGSYAVTARQTGFQTEVRNGVTLTVAAEAVVDFELTVGQVEQKVVVTGEAPIIDTRTTTLSGLVGENQIRDLPLNGRSYDQLALLSPGIVNQPNGTRNATQGEGIRLVSNGSRANGNLFLLDGTVTNDSSGQDPGGASGANLGVEAIREFRVLTHNFSAEYGRQAGAVIIAVTQSGTNDFHGSAYEFVRNNMFDARNFFNPGALPGFHRNQFGASLGGRVVKNRVFFFINYEGLRQVQGTTVISNVPDANARIGLLPNATTGVLQKTTLNPAVIPYLNLYPMPNGRDFGNGIAQYITNYSAPTTENYSMERMDFQLSDKDQLYWRFVFDPSNTALAESVPTWSELISVTNHFVVLGETHIFSPSKLNEFRFAFNRTDPEVTETPYVVDNHALDFIPGTGFGTATFAATGQNNSGSLSTLGTTSAFPAAYTQNLFEVADNFSYLKGPHSFKFGFDLERIQLNESTLSYQRGAYTFSSLAGFLAGTPSQVQLSLLAQSNPERGFRQDVFGWFVQDDYRLRPNLTLNLGLRHEFVTSPNEVNGRNADLINITDPSSTVGPPFLTAKLNFAPRVGVAWDPFGKGKTSIRASGGVFYNQLLGRIWYFFSGSDSRFLSKYIVRNPPNFPNALLSGFTPALSATDSVQYNTQTPTIVEYNLDVQQQVAPTVSVSVGFVGSHGYNLEDHVAPDTRIPQVQANGSLFFPATAPFVNPHFSFIDELTTQSTSNYNAMQVIVNKTFSHGLLLQGNYTFSRDLSDADTTSNSQVLTTAPDLMNPYDFAQDYGRSVFDRTQALVITGRYELPFGSSWNSKFAKEAFEGWEINGIYQYGTGFPLDIFDGFNNSQDGDSNFPDRPNLNAGFSSNPIRGTTAGCQGIAAGQKLSTPSLWFDPCAFSLSTAGTFGNLGRNTVTGPPLNDFDFALLKTFNIKENIKFQFRAESFNILNHANFDAPNNTVFSSTGARTATGGVITATAIDNREIQLGARLSF